MLKQLVLFFCLIITLKGNAQDLYNLQSSILFAEYLFKTQQYDYAAKEYERILFLNPKSDTIKLNLIISYRNTGNFSFAISRAEQLYTSVSFYPQPFSLEYSKLLLADASHDKLKLFLKSNAALEEQDKIQLELTSELFNRNWSAAQILQRKLDSLHFVSNDAYKNIIEEGINLKYKSPALAIGLSAIVPGSGKFYTKDWKDGLISLIGISASAFQSYRGFNKYGTSSGRGWIYGGLALGLYSGNLYGSHKAAKRYNSKLNENIHKKVKDLFNSSF